MPELERIVENVNISMSMENMALTEKQKQLGRDILSGKTSHEEALKAAVAKYAHPPAGERRG